MKWVVVSLFSNITPHSEFLEDCPIFARIVITALHLGCRLKDEVPKDESL